MIALILSAMLAAAAPAKAAPDPETAQVAAALAKEGFSPAGIKVLSSQPAGLQQELAGFRQRASEIGVALSTAKAAGDVAAFGKAMREGDALNAEIQRSRTEQMLRVLGQLSPADRKIFFTHVGPPTQRSAPAGR